MKLSKKDWLIIGLISCILVVVIGAVAFFSFKFRDIDLHINEISELKQVIPKDGKNGADGKIETIVSYLPAKDGMNGKDATPQQIQQAVDSYMADHPVKNGKDGKDGVDGLPGRLVIIRQNVLGLWECQLVGDSAWQPAQECAQ